MGLKELLKDFLEGAAKLAILGVGSTLRGDDAAGMAAADILLERYGAMENIRVYHGETAPENYSGSIRRFAPSHLLVIDAANLDRPVATIAPIDLNDVGGLSCCTHMLPLKVMLGYLADETGMKVLLMGIQPKSLGFEDPLTQEAQAAVKTLCGALCEAVEGVGLV